MANADDIHDLEKPDWRLLAWPITGFLTGVIVTGAFVLFAIFH